MARLGTGEGDTMTVRETVHGRVLVVHMEREAKRNAVDREMAEGIGAALDRLDDDEQLWVGSSPAPSRCSLRAPT